MVVMAGTAGMTLVVLVVLAGALHGEAAAAWKNKDSGRSDSSRSASLRLLNASSASGAAEAKCLDGSPGGYYFRAALNASYATKWVFSLQGGGECVTEEDCASRAEGDLGSSAAWASDGSSQFVQFQEDDSDRNPDFYAWNHVFVMYCTGDLHLGQVTNPGDNQWGWAYFSGALVVDAVIEDLKESDGLDQASLVVWSGDSAGGIGSGALLDGIQGQLPDARVVGAPIAGFYWNNSHPYTGPGAGSYTPFDTSAWMGYQSLWEMRLPDSCVNARPSDPWVCGLLNFSIPTIQAEIFVIEFLTDSVQLGLHDGVPEYNNDTADFVLGFGRNMTTALTQQVVGQSRRGVFAPTCYEHTDFDASKPFIDGESYITAFGSWLFNRTGTNDASFLMDDCCSTGEVVFNPTC